MQGAGEESREEESVLPSSSFHFSRKGEIRKVAALTSKTRAIYRDISGRMGTSVCFIYLPAVL